MTPAQVTVSVGWSTLRSAERALSEKGWCAVQFYLADHLRDLAYGRVEASLGPHYMEVEVIYPEPEINDDSTLEWG